MPRPRRDAGAGQIPSGSGKGAGLYCGARLRKGEVFAYAGLPENLKD